jgi:hypothetical protein
MSKSAEILGRAWLYEYDQPDVEIWCHELVPMDSNCKRPAYDWALCHFQELDNESLRDLFDLPKKGSFQVLFRGHMEGEMSGYFEPEWDEWFEITELRTEEMSEEYLKVRLGDCPVV